MRQRPAAARRGPQGGVALVAVAVAAWICAPQAGAVAAVADVPAAAQSWSARTAPAAQIAFVRLVGDPQNSNNEIWTMGSGGGYQRQLTSNAVADLEPEWSPNGEWIAWTRFETQYNTGASDIWLMRADGTDQHRLTDLHADLGTPTWSPDGKRLAFTRDYRIWVVNADGTNLRAVSPVGAFDFDPDWSPNGQWIAFSSNGPRTFDLFAMRSDGSHRHLLAATGGVDEYDAAWSPDSRQIAYSAYHRYDGVGWHVSAMRADGTGRHVVMDNYSLNPAWAPGGFRLAFYACATQCSLHTSTLGGLNLTLLGYRGYSDVQPDYRPYPPAANTNFGR